MLYTNKLIELKKKSWSLGNPYVSQLCVKLSLLLLTTVCKGTLGAFKSIYLVYGAW